MITCFSDHDILGKALHQCSENPLRIMLRPFRTASERLEGNIKTLSKLCGIRSKILCVPESIITENISLRMPYDPYLGIF